MGLDSNPTRGVETEPAHPRRSALGWLCRPGADGASTPAIRGRRRRHGEPLAVRRPLEKHGPSGALRVSLGEWIVFVAPLDLLVFVIPLDVPRSSCAPDVRS